MAKFIWNHFLIFSLLFFVATYENLIDSIHIDSFKPHKPTTLSQKNHMAPKARTRWSRVGPNWDHHRPSSCRHSHFFKIILSSIMRDMKLVMYYIAMSVCCNVFNGLAKFIWNHFLIFFPTVLCYYIWFLCFGWTMSSTL